MKKFLLKSLFLSALLTVCACGQSGSVESPGDKRPTDDEKRTLTKPPAPPKDDGESDSAKLRETTRKANEKSQAESLNKDHAPIFAALSQEFSTFSEVFSAYRATEEAVTQTLSFDPASDWRRLVVFSHDLTIAQNEEAFAASQYEARSLGLLQKIDDTCGSYNSKAKNIKPDLRLDLTQLCVGGHTTLEEMKSYANGRGLLFKQREQQAQAAVKAQIKILQEREVAAETEPARRASVQLQLSTDFLKKATAAIQERRKPATTVAGLPDLSEEYGRWLGFQKFASVCSGTIASWQETGCLSLNRDLISTNVLVKEFGSKILRYLPSAARSPAEAALLEKIRQAVAADRIADALIEYDALLASREQAQPAEAL